MRHSSSNHKTRCLTSCLPQHHAFCPASPLATSNTSSKSIIAIAPSSCVSFFKSPQPHQKQWPIPTGKNVMHVTDRLQGRVLGRAHSIV